METFGHTRSRQRVRDAAPAPFSDTDAFIFEALLILRYRFPRENSAIPNAGSMLPPRPPRRGGGASIHRSSPFVPNHNVTRGGASHGLAPAGEKRWRSVCRAPTTCPRNPTQRRHQHTPPATNRLKGEEPTANRLSDNVACLHVPVLDIWAIVFQSSPMKTLR